MMQKIAIVVPWSSHAFDTVEPPLARGHDLAVDLEMFIQQRCQQSPLLAGARN
jgi:hypothetical protein